MTSRPIILASSSPRRQQLLRDAGISFDVVAPSADAETMAAVDEDPATLVARLAFQKAADVIARVGSAIVVACDTVAACDGRILGKPRDEADARAMLAHLSGRQHEVYSGLCVWSVPEGGPTIEVDRTILRMDPLRPEQIEEYLASGLWRGKAGAFGYQDRLDWVHVVAGSESNVVGLPMERLIQMLAAARPS